MKKTYPFSVGFVVRSTLAASLLLLSLAGCGSYNALGGSDTRQRPADWKAQSHSHEVAPDYALVFPEDQVKRLDIAISPADWALMQEDMQTLYGNGMGAPGGSGGPGGPGAFGPPPGFPDSEASASPAGEPVTRPSGLPEGWTPGQPWPSGWPSPPPRPEGAGGPPGGFGAGPPGGPGGYGPLGGSENPVWRPVTISFEGQTWQHVGMRYKGNSSLRSSWGRTEKLPFRLNFDYFEDDYPSIHNQRFFGFKKLTFSSGFTDDSLIREKVVADIFRAAGVPAARTAFYRVYLDHGEGSQYLGLYTLVEAPDTPMLQAQFGNDSGNLYKPSGSGAQFQTFAQASFEKQTHETSADWSDVQAVFAALHADRSDAARWRAGLERVFDVPGFLRYLAVNTLIQNWDSYGRMAHNYYLYADPGLGGRLRWIPWDHNMALAESMGGGGLRPGGFALPEGLTPPERPAGAPGGGPGGGALSLALSASEVGDSWPLIRYLIDDPVYQARYVDEIKKALNGAFARERTRQRYQQAHSLIRPYVIGPDGERTASTLLSSPDAFDPALEALYTHLDQRHAAAAEFLASLSD